MLNGPSQIIRRNILFSIAAILTGLILISLSSAPALAVAPVVTVTSPNGGEFLAGGSTYNITWTATDDDFNLKPNPITIDYYDGSTWVQIATNEPNDGSYSWTVPGLDISTAKIRVTAEDMDLTPNIVSDESDADFTIDSTDPLVTVISPNGGEYWAGGSSQTITWIATDTNIATNPINLYYDNGSTLVPIATNEPNDGTYDWTVPGLNISTASVIVTATDLAGNSGGDGSNADFTIDSIDPLVTVISPNGGEYWAGGSSQTISWTSTDTNMATNPITLDYYDGSTWVQIATNEPNDGTYDWTVPSLDISTASVRVTAADLAGNTGSDESNFNLTIDSTDPTVIVTTPNGGEYWVGGSSQTINWIATDTNMASNPITIEYYNGSSWEEIATNEPNDGSYGWTVPSMDISNVRMRVTAADLLGNTGSDDSDANFTIDSTDPLVTLTSPNGGEYWAGGSSQTISWTATDANMNDNPITLEYYDGWSWVGIATVESNDGSFGWTVPGLDISTARVRVTAADKVGNTGSDESDADFTIDSTAPEVLIDDVPEYINALYSIVGTAADTLPGELDRVQIQISDFMAAKYWDGDSWEDTQIWLDATETADWSYDISSITFTNGNVYSVTAKSIDRAGNESTNDSDSFTFDSISPVVTLNEIPDLVEQLFISGTAHDDSPGLLDRVQVQIHDTSVDTYWNGSFWINAESSWLNAAGKEGWSYGTDSITFTSGNIYTIYAKSIDKAGNESTEDSDSFTFVATYATVTNVTSTSTDGTYNPGDDIEITVIFSEEVNVTGNPYLELDMGTDDCHAIYESGDGTDTLTFIYTIQAGDISSDLDYLDTDSLKLNGGTITNAAGDDADLTLADPGSDGSLGANNDLVIEEGSQGSSMWIILVSVFGVLGLLLVTGIIIKRRLATEKA